MLQQYIEIFTLVTGLAYLVLEIAQKNAMWIVGMITSAAAVYMFAAEELYASQALNVYYLFVSAAGLVQWRKDKKRLSAMSASGASPEAESGGKPGKIHLNRLSLKTAVWSAAAAVAGTLLLGLALKQTGDRMPWTDATIAILNAIATYWLSRSYWQQWCILIVANILSSVLCHSQGLYWMTAQYVFYTAASVYGLVHWRRSGVYVWPVPENEKA